MDPGSMGLPIHGIKCMQQVHAVGIYDSPIIPSIHDLISSFVSFQRIKFNEGVMILTLVYITGIGVKGRMAEVCMTCMSWVSKGQSATALGRIRGIR